MKKLDNKKIILLVVLILAIALVIFLAIKQSSKKKDGKLANDEETKIAETATIDYITKLTYGQGTAYNGLDLLYNRDSVTYDDLTVGNILTTAFEYAVNNSESEVSNTVINALKNDGFDTDNMTIISGSSIRNAIKKIFGVDFDNKDYSAGINYKFQYFYNSEFDVYLRSTTELAVNTDNTYLLYKIIKTTIELFFNIVGFPPTNSAITGTPSNIASPIALLEFSMCDGCTYASQLNKRSLI